MSPVTTLSPLSIEPDILADHPGVFTVARYTHPHGTKYDVTVNLRAVDGTMSAAAQSLIPGGVTVLDLEHTDTLGCEDGDEITTSYWTGV